jgi:tetratricopeptide (TPR) repeat protein
VATKAEARRAPSRRSAREALLDNHNPVDIAMAAVASGKALPDVARRVLEEQADLLRAQRVELRMRHVGETVRAALWAILAIAAFAIIALIAAVVVRAAKSDALIVQSFRVPPPLEAKGMSGEVVATQVLDKLAEMQSTSESARAASSYANNWENDLKIDIPNTGASTDQVWKLLRGWLGKETRISGEVIETGAGIALTARVGARPGQRFVSETGNLDAVIAQGAELIFRSTQPYRHAIYLGDIPERMNERHTLLQQLTHDPSPIERKWAFNGLAYDLRRKGDFRGSIVMARRALAIDPEMLPALGNLAAAHSLLGHDQQAFDVNLLERRTEVGVGYDPRIVAANRCGQLADMGSYTRNPRQIDEAAACLESSSGSYSAYAAATRLDGNWLRHEAAPLLAFRQPVMAGVPDIDAAAVQAFQQLRGEMVRGASPALSRALDVYAKAADARASSGPNAAFYRAGTPTQSWPVQAEALALLGRNAEARALAAQTPLDCYECVRARGLVAARSGQPMAAQRWFAEAARQGPRLPAAFVDWARLLAAHRRFDGAEARFAKAAKLASNWADPLKYWGDALAARGKPRDALAKYDAALKLAPKWAELRQARARLARP